MKNIPMLVNDGLIATLVILAVSGLIVFIIVMLKRHTNLFHKDERPDDKTITHQELDRVLRDVDDEETKREMDEYNKNHTTYDDKDPKDHQ